MTEKKSDFLTDFYNRYNKEKGLGDSIERITKATGIKKVVDVVNKVRGKKDCGCNKRKEVLNKAFPYKK